MNGVDISRGGYERHELISLPVVEEGRLCGIVTIEDVGRAVRGSKQQIPAREIMTKRVEVVSEGESLYTAWMRMTRRGFKHLPVVSDGHPEQVIGEVTLATIGRVLHVPIHSQERDDHSDAAAELQASEQNGLVRGEEPGQERVLP